MGLPLYLERLSASVKAETDNIRSTFKNSTNKESGFETIVRNLLSVYTPSVQSITHGEIIDTFDHRSGQIDIAIVHETHPTGYKDGRPNILLYDLITAIGETKLLLNLKELLSAVEHINKMLPFRRHDDNNNIPAAKFYGNENNGKQPPYFLIALRSNISLGTISEKINESNISMVIILEHTSSKTGIIVQGSTHTNKDVFTNIDKLSSRRVADQIGETDNPMLILIWAINRFATPYLSLTNVIPMYFQ